jgi:predicted RNA-binding protein with PIN domain
VQVLIVDAHSVIFTWPELRQLHVRRMALAREVLMKKLTAYHDFSGHHVVVVFDGQGKRFAEETEPGGIQCFYSGQDQTADDIIERLVASYSNLHQITVATSDLLEQQTVTSFGASFLSAESLRSLLEESEAEFQKALRQHNQRNR